MIVGIRSLSLIALSALALTLSACGGGGGSESSSPVIGQPEQPTEPDLPITTDPATFLDTPRFRIHQPKVLEQIGAHHAYARGLTGKGVRIGIEDTIVDYTQEAEFGNRVKLRAADGAVLWYPRPLGDNPFSEVQTCQTSGTCEIFAGNSQGDIEAFNRWTQEVVARFGWPTRDDSLFIYDEYYSEFDSLERLYRWTEVPTPYGGDAHGTVVAATAAGRNLGVAPEATIIPIAINLTDDQGADNLADHTIRQIVASLPRNLREAFDDENARGWREDYANFDVINRSFGMALFDPDVISAEIESELRWFRRYMPKTVDAYLQVNTPDSEKTIFIYAAGNEGQPYSGIGADLPYYLPVLRGFSLSVAATDPSTGRIADYSNRCGSIPPNWNSLRYGPHYCLAAPGTVRALVPNPNSPGNGNVQEGWQGTSFAAPVVSGAFALLKERFRATRGNTAIVKRMLDTADRTGPYANLEIYGAGHLDLEAALSPVGTLNAGQSAHALGRTVLQLPAAFGSVAPRTSGIELAAFDDQDFPFWVPLSALIYEPPVGRSLIPQFERQDAVTPTFGPNVLKLYWTSLEGAGSGSLSNNWTWVVGFGPTSASVARSSPDGSWEYGVGFDGDGHLGTQTSGAFGADIRSAMVWAAPEFEHDLGDGWSLDATSMLAISAPDYEKNAIFEASPAVLSALSVRVGTAQTGLTVEQPLRAESGTGTFRVENGRIEDGRRLYDEYRIRLRPDARELRMTLRHELNGVGGRIAVEVGGALNAGHISGEKETRLGVAYRTTW